MIKTSKTGTDLEEGKIYFKQGEKDLKSRKKLEKQKQTSKTDKDFKT